MAAAEGAAAAWDRALRSAFFRIWDTEVQIRALAWMEVGMVFRFSQVPAAGVTAAGTTRAEVGEAADRLSPGVAEEAALEQTEAQLKERSLHSLVLIHSLPAVTVETVQAVEVEELCWSRRQMRWTGKPAAVATAVAVAAEPAPARMIFRTPCKEVWGAQEEEVAAAASTNRE